MNGLVFDDALCELVPLMVPVIPRQPRERDYIRVCNTPLPRATSKIIVAAVADYYGLSVTELCSASHARRITHPRQLGMYLCRELTKLSFTQISAAFGRSDHATSLIACRVVKDRLGFDPKTLEAYEAIRDRVR